MGKLESFLQLFILVCMLESIHNTEKGNKQTPRLSLVRCHLPPEFSSPVLERTRPASRSIQGRCPKDDTQPLGQPAATKKDVAGFLCFPGGRWRLCSFSCLPRWGPIWDVSSRTSEAILQTHCKVLRQWGFTPVSVYNCK